jgi:8-amino-7-oxononanoate synthase
MRPGQEDLEERFRDQLREWERRGIARCLRSFDGREDARLRYQGQGYVSFGSNDYLGLSFHPRVLEAIRRALEIFGAGAGASPMVCGYASVHRELEQALADWKGTEAVCLFSSGYAAAVGSIPALAGPGDVLLLDRLCHASLWDGARLSGARVRVFAHNDLEALERALERYSRGARRVFVIAESVYSMDGDCCPLEALVELKDRWGAWLFLDEAHAAGLYGKEGAGLASHLGLSERIEFQLGTLSKALGSVGGYLASRLEVIRWVRHRGRSFMYSTALAPAVAAGAMEALAILRSCEGKDLQALLWKNVRELSPEAASAILPVVVGEEERARELAEQLWALGIYVPAIRYPTVPKGGARLRISVSSRHSSEQIQRLKEIFKRLGISL